MFVHGTTYAELLGFSPDEVGLIADGVKIVRDEIEQIPGQPKFLDTFPVLKCEFERSVNSGADSPATLWMNAGRGDVARAVFAALTTENGPIKSYITEREGHVGTDEDTKARIAAGVRLYKQLTGKLPVEYMLIDLTEASA